MNENKYLPILTKGIIKENPVFRLMLGACPALAVTTTAFGGFGMGLAVTLTLIGTNTIVSALRNQIPEKVRIPSFIVLIAGLVTIIQMLVRAYAPALDQTLGIFLPLIVVNCVIFARAEMFAVKQKVLPSLFDAIGTGLGFTLALTFMGATREVLGTGAIAGLQIGGGRIEPMIIMLLPPGGFFVYGVLIAIANKFDKRPLEERTGGCGACPSRAVCKHAAGLYEEGGAA